MNNERLIAVTGASRGIGAAIALELARRGFRVACLTRRGAGPETDLPPALACRFVNHACDVTDEASVREALKAIAADGASTASSTTPASISRRRATSWTSPPTNGHADQCRRPCSRPRREAYPYLVKAAAATIVNIGSFFDKVGVKRNLAYCASKAAVGAMTRCLAVEWAAQGIRVLDVAPGYIVTDLNRDALESGPCANTSTSAYRVGRPARRGEVARLVAAIFAEDIRFLSGETIYVDGGQGIAH